MITQIICYAQPIAALAAVIIENLWNSNNDAQPKSVKSVKSVVKYNFRNLNK